MSEQWMGLHNPDQHEFPSDSGAYCRTCAGIVCWEDTPCRCCLEAEVEVLRAQVQRVAELQFVPIVTGDRAADQVLRVQVLKDQDNLRRALDGDA